MKKRHKQKDTTVSGWEVLAEILLQVPQLLIWPLRLLIRIGRSLLDGISHSYTNTYLTQKKEIQQLLNFFISFLLLCILLLAHLFRYKTK